jgi:hypothetical protein
MKTQHTPGPWHRDATEQTFHTKGLNLRAPDGSSIAALFGSKSDECIANANLIAAAPDLLEALEYLLPIAEKNVETSFGKDAIRIARSTIAKAKGETQ